MERTDLTVAAPGVQSQRALDARELIDALHALRQAQRDQLFWERLCRCLTQLARADFGLVLQLDDGAWRPLCSLPPAAEPLAAWPVLVGELAGRALQNGFARASGGLGGARGHILVAVRLGGNADLLLLLAIPERERQLLNELLLRVQLVADLPMAPPAQAAAAAAAPGGELLDLLDLVIQVQREQRFGAACLALVNGIVAQFGCAQAAIGWQRDGYVDIHAISHIDRFERTTAEVQMLQAALEEALDQAQEIRYPEDRDSGRVVIAHARAMQASGYSQVCSLPLRLGAEAPQAALWLAQHEGVMDPRRLAQLQLALGLLLPWLAALKERDRWWGARLGSWSAQRLRPWLGPDHVGRKAAVLALSALLLYLLFGSWHYRVEANGQLTTDSTALISAPFDGYLHTVAVTAGDEVAEGAALAGLDTQELFLQESEIRADLRRFDSEANKARAVSNLVEVEIAMARRAQAQARLDRVSFYLRQAQVKAPFRGVVVEGERKDLLGAPVKKGDRMFRLARIEGLYLVLTVPESDIRDVAIGATGELALLSQPDRNIPIRTTDIIPMAQVKGQEGNHFLVKAKFEQPPEAWWRPGMSGVVRLDAGDRNIAWILTHRLVDAMRLKFWW